jgi:glyoxylase-like metal-dependent hydrolase (beta-lactamase superfamily II)
VKTNPWLEASVPCSAALPDETHFRQFRDPATETFSYLIGCCRTGQAAIIDPVISHVPLYLGVLKELDLQLTWIFETHLHADHISAADSLREWTGARVAVGGRAGISCADSLVDDTDTLTIGALTLDVVATPGHTAGCVTYRWADRLFTGDSLLIGGCGAINEPGSSGLTLFDSVTRRLFCLDD